MRKSSGVFLLAFRFWLGQIVLRYLAVGLLIESFLLHAQVAVVLPDTTLVRGSSVDLPITLGAALEPGDTLEFWLRYPRAALHIENVASRFPQRVAITRRSDEPSGADGILHIRAFAAEQVRSIEVWLQCQVLWSGPDAGQFTATDLLRNSQHVPFQVQGGMLRLEPTSPLRFENLPSLGPIFPHPIVTDRIGVSFWLAQDATVELVLYDPLGREYQRWTFAQLIAGVHTVELPIERNGISAGAYHLQLRTGGHVVIAPCMIAK